ncbi:MAG: polysaccharide biosynthesis/export family protein [Bacteroidetes bacterium]|nr:polysaccharide biosynthesis/export family protein [Bacteroidota bacterium]MBS1931535.1 polysaccharide biosynthesis/export family protein [Bacteroidota bacterium]
MKLIRLFVLFTFSAIMISCAVRQKTPTYLENVGDTSSLINTPFPELHIQKNDLLSIQVYSASTMPQISDTYYNLLAMNSSGATGSAGQSSAGATSGNSSGFLVDVNGDIEYPRLGTLHVEGLSKIQLADLIKKKINEKDTVLINPSVIIRFLNYKVNVLGQVGHEGEVNVSGERLTILEAIGLAGGITDYGKKNDVKVVREINGKIEIGTIDLSSKNLFDSPYYNLMQNDLVIVYPTKQKSKMVDQTIVTQRISLALSIITASAFLYNIFK